MEPGDQLALNVSSQILDGEHVQAKLLDSGGPAAYEQDDREWVVIYRTAEGFCCMYRGLPVNFEDMLDVQTWTEEMDVRPYFMGL